jgi:hypothetical protein
MVRAAAATIASVLPNLPYPSSNRCMKRDAAPGPSEDAFTWTSRCPGNSHIYRPIVSRMRQSRSSGSTPQQRLHFHGCHLLSVPGRQSAFVNPLRPGEMRIGLNLKVTAFRGPARDRFSVP